MDPFPPARKGRGMTRYRTVTSLAQLAKINAVPDPPNFQFGRNKVMLTALPATESTMRSTRRRRESLSALDGLKARLGGEVEPLHALKCV